MLLFFKWKHFFSSRYLDVRLLGVHFYVAIGNGRGRVSRQSSRFEREKKAKKSESKFGGLGNVRHEFFGIDEPWGSRGRKIAFDVEFFSEWTRRRSNYGQF